ncbi:hypothetical protein StrepF001_25645 [Streptomyces sp. F001]|nr:hypothetical protein StrepF001_25645 [Streptomyces sp. F001]
MAGPGERPSGGLRLHRDLLQPPATAEASGLGLPHPAGDPATTRTRTRPRGVSIECPTSRGNFQGRVVSVFAGHTRELRRSCHGATELVGTGSRPRQLVAEGAPLPGHCVLPSPLATITRTVTVAAGRFAPGHLGELTAIVPFELVDAVLSETRVVQRRLRDLPSRVGVYFLLAMCMFPEVGYRLVWAKLTAGLSGMPVVRPSTKALRDLRRRLRQRAGACVVRGVGRAVGPANHAGSAVRPVSDSVVRRLQLDQGA